MTIVLALSALTLGFASVSFSAYLQRTSAQRAAQVFAQDLSAARSAALRARAPVVIRFFEDTRWYSLGMQGSGTELARRRFGVNADIALSNIDLVMAGDSLVFDRRGIADLSGSPGSVGEATFSSGTVTYRVRFNAMGAAKVEEI